MLARSSMLISKLAVAATVAYVAVCTSPTLFGQNNDDFLVQRVVGGVVVDANGTLTGEMQKLSPTLRDDLARGLAKVDSDINQAGRRVVSLKGLEAAINDAATNGQPVPADVAFLAGLQRIEFIIVSPEDNDVLLVGPGEGWKIDERGNVVGQKSGLPVLKLEDFIVAMRTVNNAREGDGISVSIDPTEEGIIRLQNYYQHVSAFNPNMAADVRDAMGLHNISLTGVPTDSRYAQILVAADYKMKQLSMGIIPSPIADFPSILEMAQKKDANNLGTMAPRFWMECNYEPVAKSDDGNVWQIRGQGVKTMTEEQYFDRDGVRHEAKKPNKFAQRWAENMTSRFEELSTAEPVFRELRNLMDMSVVAALIAKEDLLAKAQLQIPNIDGSNQAVATPSWESPKTVPTSCSFVRTSSNWIVTASGGVLVDSWAVASNSESIPNLRQQAPSTQPTINRWWWNAN